MPKSVNDKVLDSVYIRAVDLSRYEVQVQNEIIKVLNDLKNSVRKDLVDIKNDPTVPKTLRGKQARLEALQKQVNQTISTGTSKMSRKINKNLKDVAFDERETLKLTFQNAIPVEISASVNTVALSPKLLEKIADDTLIQGFKQQEWWNSLGNDLKKNFKRSMATGIARGESIGDLVNRVRSATVGNAGFPQFEKNARAIIRSSVAGVSNAVADETYQKNSDTIGSVKWVSTLDSRTTEFCIARDNKLYTVDTHEPIGHSYGWESGPGRSHFGCRSRSSPILKSADQLGIDATGKTRRAMDGKVPQDTNYESWLKTQSKKTQEKVLGKKKAELWRTGQVKSFRDLVDQTGRPKPLSKLPKLKEDK